MKAASRHFTERLKSALRQELDAARALLKALLEEQDIVAGFDEARLEQNVGRKEGLVEQLQQVSAGRIALMREHEFSDHRRGIDSCIAACGGDRGLASLFDELADVGRQCIEANRIVGRLINRRAQFIRRALDQLGGGAGAGGPAYGETGLAAQSDHISRRFGRA